MTVKILLWADVDVLCSLSNVKDSTLTTRLLAGPPVHGDREVKLDCVPVQPQGGMWTSPTTGRDVYQSSLREGCVVESYSRNTIIIIDRHIFWHSIHDLFRICKKGFHVAWREKGHVSPYCSYSAVKQMKNKLCYEDSKRERG